VKTVAIITAAGYGKRMGQPKQFLEINGKPILEWTLSVFNATKMVDEVILVVHQEGLERARQLQFPKLKQVVPGGKERQDSVYNGLKALPEDTEIVVIHDGARPFVTEQEIRRAVEEAEESGAVVVGVPVKDTIKQVSSKQLAVSSTPDRKQLWAAQTPQVFKKEIILRAFKEGYNKHQVTDDAMLVEKLGIPVKMVMGSYRNIKITTPDDLRIAEELLKEDKQ